MNEAIELRLRSLMESGEGWGRDAGRLVYRRLVDYVESNPGRKVFQVSLIGVKRVDISFASETIVELARRYRGKKGFCFINLEDVDMEENWAAAAERANQPLMNWFGGKWRILGPQPAQGAQDAFRFALTKDETRVADYAGRSSEISVNNASNKFKQLWASGFLLRTEGTAESGGTEFIYVPIK